MNDQTSADLSAWKPIITAAVDMAEDFPERYREEIFRTLLNQSGRGRSFEHPATSAGGGPKVHPPSRGGLLALAQAVGVDPGSLRRVVEIDEQEGSVQILAPRIGGSNKSDRQNRYSAVYCFVREKALGETKTDIEDLRQLCDDRGCYDSSNFTQNFRNQDLLREVTGEGNGGRMYLLSSEGVETAKDLLRELAEPGS